ncbi:hypothetical protein GCM10010387_32570 [Streptomyces inusitatus]|uniref:ApeI dehydratase-like domain-containing protein n=1 Tax=Streptomyces inusitatus TaxID=68221 RepID=A0A918Q6Q7_9ACTN|nr:hypothetical protein [Streptomyces inusitatus]GGZ35851.1 hypothetical protein GCM10010387_32570 [Streptomyces inusitatus]
MAVLDAGPVRAVPEIASGPGEPPRTVVQVDADERVFPGHYPGFPIFPGVCVVEQVRRSALATVPAEAGKVIVRAVESTRFLSPVFPGDRLTVELKWSPRNGAWRCEAVASTERGRAATVRLRLVAAAEEPGPAAGPAAGDAPRPGEGVGALTIGEIKKVLPHRYPMLLVDRVDELVPAERLTAVKAVTCNEPWYQDLAEEAGDEEHAYPQALLVESWCQAAGVLAAWDRPNPDVLSGQVMLFGSISDVVLARPVLPGEVLEHRVRLVRALSDTVIFEGESLSAGEIVMEVGRVVMAMRPAGELTGALPGAPAAVAAGAH